MRIFAVVLLAISLLFLGCTGNGKKPVDVKTAVTDTSAEGKKLSVLNDQIAAKPGDAALLHQRARILIDQKKFEEALADMQKVMSIDSSKAEYFLTMADLSFAANRTFNAKEYLEKAIAIDPENTSAMMRLAELNLIVKQHGQSVALLTKVLAKDKSNTNAWLMRGINYKESGDTNRAVDDFRSAIEADPNFYNAYMQLGMIYQLRNNPIAEGYFTNAIKIKPGSEEALYGRGLWYQDHNQFDKAIQDYTSIVQINPNNKNAYFNLGYIHQIYLKVYPEAIKHYTRAIMADPKYTEAYFNRGLCNEFMGNFQDAKFDYKTALNLRPDYPAAEEAIKRVNR